ncbi:MAG: DUF2202 domain-containing protein [Saprospiraceae bacterium]|nr:DUF2202 domain-containing protein [Saprospiraceae bacterium]MCF8252046.1 DUF2202 domain-containing protein [Saprospiraceae bacterium]MCF8281735.1 DUF2202 domain-containing protein [Bacteroidales bacterium]MCF8310377.1 DUF2202 domain-containing protein [Saprospiraceae bacterium]MCF8439755.1 DUF2202 domain-containing protein [Saprospiraceae bacterium]
MKKQMFKLIASVAMLISFAMLFTRCESDANEIVPIDSMKATATVNDVAAATTVAYDAAQVCDCLLTNFPYEALTATETAALLFMREEEKLARDVYTGLNEKWDVRIFSNIAKSEQRHMDAVLCLIDKYGLGDPVGENAAGVFVNADLQLLYNNLMDQGSTSLAAALKVGATIEDLDISDLLARMPDMGNEDIVAVFTELTKGSRNHLRAFNRNLVNVGEVYVPQYINQALFDEIISSPKETGGAICGICLGTGSGNGPGNGTGTCDGTGPHGNNGGNGTGTCPNGNTGGGGNGDGTGTCPNGNTGGGNGGNGNGGGNGGGGNGGGGNGGGGNGGGGNGGGGNGGGGN